MAMMQLKPRVMDPRAFDDISEALAFMETPDGGGAPYRVVPLYLHNWYPPGNGLRALTIGEDSRNLVGVTRYYPTLRPKVVVDFEPAPPDKFWEVEKRRYFAEQKIVYVSIYLNEKMDTDGFKERVKAATDLMEGVSRDHQEDVALAEAAPTTEQWLQNPELVAAIDAWCLQQIVANETANGRRYTGVAKLSVLRRLKREEVDAIRGGLKNGTIVDPLGRYRQSAATA